MENERELDVVLEEMKALIKFCEVTDSQELRMTVKRRLMKLSGIPKDNEWSIHNLDLNDHSDTEIVKDFSDQFSEIQLQVINDYFENPNEILSNISEKFKLTYNKGHYFITRFFRFSSKERELMLSKFKNHEQ